MAMTMASSSLGTAHFPFFPFPIFPILTPRFRGAIRLCAYRLRLPATGCGSAQFAEFDDSLVLAGLARRFRPITIGRE